MAKGKALGALLALVPKGAKGEESPGEERDESLERCRDLASQAFPNEDWSDDDRVMALKELLAYEREA
jgi:hypothetical protein